MMSFRHAILHPAMVVRAQPFVAAQRFSSSSSSSSDPINFPKHEASAKIDKASHSMGYKAAEAKEKLSRAGQNIQEGIRERVDDDPHAAEKSIGDKIKEGLKEGVEKLKATGEVVKEKLEEAVGMDQPPHAAKNR